MDSGRTVYFVCVGASEIEHPNIIWRYNGKHLTNEALVGMYDSQVNTRSGQMYTSSVLELCGIDLDDAGSYSCTAGYSKQSNSSSFTLLIS